MGDVTIGAKERYFWLRHDSEMKKGNLESSHFLKRFGIAVVILLLAPFCYGLLQKPSFWDVFANLTVFLMFFWFCGWVIIWFMLCLITYGVFVKFTKERRICVLVPASMILWFLILLEIWFWFYAYLERYNPSGLNWG